VQKYLETRTRLNDKMNEVFKKIADHKRQRDEMAQKLKQVQVMKRFLAFQRARSNLTSTESCSAASSQCMLSRPET